MRVAGGEAIACAFSARHFSHCRLGFSKHIDQLLMGKQKLMVVIIRAIAAK